MLYRATLTGLENLGLVGFPGSCQESAPCSPELLGGRHLRPRMPGLSTPAPHAGLCMPAPRDLNAHDMKCLSCSSMLPAAMHSGVTYLLPGAELALNGRLNAKYAPV